MTNVYIGNYEPNVVIFGDIMLDHNLQGHCYKIANEGPIPVINITSEKYGIGGCGNVLMNVSSLGAKKIFLFSRIGEDKNGKKLLKYLPSNTIDFLIKDANFSTINKTRIYSDNKIVARYDKEIIIPISYEQEQIIIDNFKQVISSNNISSVILSDYNKGFITKSLCQNIIKICNISNIPTIVDPKIDYTKYIGCTIIKPNRAETKTIFNIDLNTVSYEECHKSLKDLLNCKLSVVTLSGDGISASSNNIHYRSFTTTNNIIDVTGAGDVVCAVLGTYYPYINNIQLLIDIANHLASISVSNLGVYIVNNNDLINTYKYIHKTKEITIDDLVKLQLSDIIFTNGCFDILHSAHIELLKFCRSLGKTVIVGLNSDCSIKSLKGSTRPINNINERIKMLNAIDYVDFIIVFKEDTPLELIKTIEPTYLVKGGDYTVDNIVGKEYAKNVSIFNYIHGKSTTNIINMCYNSKKS
jgi:D-beta-D-heptose 7-phosphate kinase/D-beta-D-heptose 1-phosphate adenosyltransferase